MHVTGFYRICAFNHWNPCLPSVWKSPHRLGCVCSCILHPTLLLIDSCHGAASHQRTSADPSAEGKLSRVIFSHPPTPPFAIMKRQAVGLFTWLGKTTSEKVGEEIEWRLLENKAFLTCLEECTLPQEQGSFSWQNDASPEEEKKNKNDREDGEGGENWGLGSQLTTWGMSGAEEREVGAEVV